MKKVNAFETTDGQIFKDGEKARIHQTMLELISYFESIWPAPHIDPVWDDEHFVISSPKGLVDFLEKNSITIKKK